MSVLYPRLVKSIFWWKTTKLWGAEGANGKTNEGELCLKGYYGWDFVHDTKNPDSSPNSTDDPLQTWRTIHTGGAGKKRFLTQQNVSSEIRESTVTNQLW